MSIEYFQGVSSNLDFALQLTNLGYSVFPCRGYLPNSHECFCGMPDCPERGVHFSSGDPANASKDDWTTKCQFGSRPEADVGIKKGHQIFVSNQYVRQLELERLVELKRKLHTILKSSEMVELLLSLANQQCHPPFTTSEWEIRMEENGYV